MNNKIKWLLAVLIITVFIPRFSAGAYAGQSEELLNALGIWVDGYTGNVTRAVFAETTVNLLGLKQTANLFNSEQIFEDVPPEHTNAAAIQILSRLGYMDGVEPSRFDPEAIVTPQQLSKTILLALGFANDAIGSDSYITAIREGIFKNVDISNGITYDALAEILENTISTPMVVNMGAQSVKSGTKNQPVVTILGKYFKTERYEAKILSVNKTGVVDVEIISSQQSERILGYKDGEKISVLSSQNNVEFLEQVVDIWINSNRNIVYCRVIGRSDVFFSYITEINDDIKPCYGKDIEKIAFTNTGSKSQRPAADFEIYFNGADAMNTTHNFIKRLAKVTASSGRITKLEVFDMSEGGIITDVNQERLSYVHGMEQKEYIDISDYQNIYVILNRQVSDYSVLKADMLFDFYASENNDILYVSASDYKVADRLTDIKTPDHNHLSGKIYLGGVDYWLSTVFDVYYSNLFSSFSGDNDWRKLLDNHVEVWLDGADEVRYVSLDSRFDKTGNQEFYGILVGTDITPLGNNRIKLYKITKDAAGNSAVDLGIYDMVNKVKMPCSMTVFVESASKRRDDSLWIFRTNSKGEVYEILDPKEEKSYNLIVVKSIVINSWDNLFSFDITWRLPGKDTRDGLLGWVPMSGASIVGLIEIDRELKAMPVSIADFGWEVYGAATACMLFRNPLQQNIELALFWDDEREHSFLTSYYTEFSFINSVSKIVDEHGDEKYKINATNKGGQDVVYTVGSQLGQKFVKNALFAYRPTVVFSPDNLALSSPADGVNIAPDSDNYFMKNLTNSSLYEEAEDITASVDANNLNVLKQHLYKGKVYRKANQSIWFEDSDRYLFSIHNTDVMRLTEKNEIVRSSIDLIQVGDYIYFYLDVKGNIDYIITKQ